jgi:hypothetical protein
MKSHTDVFLHIPRLCYDNFSIAGMDHLVRKTYPFKNSRPRGYQASWIPSLSLAGYMIGLGHCSLCTEEEHRQMRAERRGEATC